MLVLAAAGAVPVWALIGWRWHALVLAPLAGAVLAAVAGACTLAVAGAIVPWFVSLSVGVTVVSLWARWRRRALDRRPVSRHASRENDPRSVRWAGFAGAVLVLSAAAWSLRPLRAPSVGWDARTIWLLRASWFAGGHGFLSTSFRNPYLLIAHSSYPPLVSTAVAVSWQVSGVHGDRLGVVVVAVLNACAAIALGWVLVEAGREAARRTEHERRRAIALVAGVASGTLLVLAAFGVVGPFATNGYADPLWSFAAAAAVGYGLLLPFDVRHMGAASVLVLVAGLTKQEGVATAMALVVLFVLRSLAHVPWDAPDARRLERANGSVRRRARSARRAVVIRRECLALGLAGLAFLAAWPVLARLLHAPPDVNTSGTREGTFWHRIHLTLDWMTPHLHVLLLAVPIAVLGALLLRTERRATGLANDGWAWAGLAIGLFVVGWAYASGPGDTAYWLLTSVHRTTMFAAVTAWLIVGGWAIAATGAAPSIAADEREGTEVVRIPVHAGIA
jgi:hypothetical protein